MLTTPTQPQPDPDDDSATRPAPAAMAAPQKGRRRISISVINFWLDALILVILSLLGWVSATLQVVFPPPTRADGWTLWTLTFDQWRDIQFGILCAFALGILLHVMMHWNWICSVIAAQIVRSRSRPDEGMQTIYGVIILIFLLHVIAFGVGAAMYCVHRPTP